ncbi:hypothetical protein [Streptomyces sp. UG1]|uniref:hypothetical protein n=1 Tax=Streptomyces sp. UG1 TaxID=3417652 RepID=UPI003CF0AD33
MDRFIDMVGKPDITRERRSPASPPDPGKFGRAYLSPGEDGPLVQPSPDPNEQGDCSDHPKGAAYTKYDYPGRGGCLPLTLEVDVINDPPEVGQDQKANHQHEGGEAHPDNDVVTEFRCKVHFRPFVRSQNAGRHPSGVS